ncbi:TPA: hypothetical protein ACIX2C_005192 [Escherichia coli]
MIFKCIQCERDITALHFHSAIAVMSGKYHIPAVRVTLVCPYCSQHFSADVPVMEFSRPDREDAQ